MPTYTITAWGGVGGSISPGGNVSVSAGGSRTFTIVPGSGYLVSHIYVDGADQGAITSYTFTGVTANHTISAAFVLASATTMLSIDYAQNWAFHADIYMAIYDENMNLVADGSTVEDRSFALSSYVRAGHTYHLYCSWSSYETADNGEAWYTVTATQAAPGGSFTWEVPY